MHVCVCARVHAAHLDAGVCHVGLSGGLFSAGARCSCAGGNTASVHLLTLCKKYTTSPTVSPEATQSSHTQQLAPCVWIPKCFCRRRTFSRQRQHLHHGCTLRVGLGYADCGMGSPGFSPECNSQHLHVGGGTRDAGAKKKIVHCVWATKSTCPVIRACMTYICNHSTSGGVCFIGVVLLLHALPLPILPTFERS